VSTKRACRLAQLLVAAAAFVCVTSSAQADANSLFFPPEYRDFAARLDAGALSRLGVQVSGRVAVLDTVAREQLSQMTGQATLDALPPAVAYLEIYFGAGPYLDRPLIAVREKALRGWVVGKLDAASAEAFGDTHRLPPAALLDEDGYNLLYRAGRATPADANAAAGVRSLRNDLPDLAERKDFRVPIERLSLRYGAFLAQNVLRIAPGDAGQWRSAEEVLGPAGSTQPAGPVAGTWRQLRRAWLVRDAAAVNRLAVDLDDMLREAASSAYPSPRAQRLELIYNRTRQGTVVFAGFAVAMLLLILAAASRGRFFRWAGLGVFLVSTAMLGAGFFIRWILSGREWYLPPIMNQFEAVIGSALLGAVLGVVLELASPRNYYALAASLYATVALLMGFFLPGTMGAGIAAQHGILASPVMAVHVAVIIVGHALVGMTAVISLTYLGVAAVKGLGARDDAAGASSPPSLTPAGEMSALAAIDRCNLIVAQLACWTVVAGTLLGAYWGDFAWGRWWGWDPKETWALITALVYVALLHARFAIGPRRRGLFTALVCLLGTAVMLFNWIVVNYFLAGKHSYA
jgi:ABC-type transport system involved in cytochrome c biogenesis permease subunit